MSHFSIPAAAKLKGYTLRLVALFDWCARQGALTLLGIFGWKSCCAVMPMYVDHA